MESAGFGPPPFAHFRSKTRGRPNPRVSAITRNNHIFLHILTFYPGRRPVFREQGVSNSTVSNDVTLKKTPRMEFWLFPQMFWVESTNWNRSSYVPARAIQSGGQLKMSFQNFRLGRTSTRSIVSFCSKSEIDALVRLG